MTRRLDELDRIEVSDRAALASWLEAHHRQKQSEWLVTARKGEPHYFAYDDIVCELLRFGWIDSLPRALDARRTMLLISPRKAGSNWSRANRERVAWLEQAELMHPSGTAAVTEARADGSWERLMDTESGEAPPDLALAVKRAGLQEAWSGLSLATRRRVLEGLLAAKRPETRAARIARICAAVSEGKDPTRWTPKS